MSKPFHLRITRNRKKLICMLPLFLGATALLAQTNAAPVPVIYPTDADRHILPIKQPVPEAITIYDARQATPPARFDIAAPAPTLLGDNGPVV